jgi:hypothetical protein
MTKLIQRENFELEPRTKQILELANGLIASAEEVKRQIHRSVAQMKECGRLLTEEKEYVLKEHGPKSWESYFEIVFSKTFSRTRAFEWMKMARVKSQLPTSDSPTQPQVGLPNERPQIQVYPLEETPNDIRKGMLALDLFPPKKHVPTSEAGIDAPTPANPPYSNVTLIAIVSRFCAWHSSFMNQYAGTVTQEQASLLLKDLKPVTTFIDQLRA